MKITGRVIGMSYAQQAVSTSRIINNTSVLSAKTSQHCSKQSHALDVSPTWQKLPNIFILFFHQLIIKVTTTAERHEYNNDDVRYGSMALLRTEQKEITENYWRTIV